MSGIDYLGITDGRVPDQRMGFPQKLLVTLLVTVIGVPLILFGLFLVVVLPGSTEQSVGGEITLTSEWVEIVPERALKASRQYRTINLDVVEPLQEYDVDSEHIAFRGGIEVRPEVQLVDQSGNAHAVELERTVRGNGVGGYADDVPQGTVFTKVRVRSDKPLHVTSIVWSCWDGK